MASLEQMKTIRSVYFTIDLVRQVGDYAVEHKISFNKAVEQLVIKGLAGLK